MIVQWMIGMVLASALVALSAWSLERVLRAWRLPVRWVWVGGVLAVMLLPWFSWLLARASQAGVVVAPSPLLLELDPSTVTALPRGAAWTAQPIWNVVAVALWGVLGSAALIVYLAGWARLDRARRRWRPARVAGAPVLVAPGVGPAAVGVLQPVIVVPDWLLERDERVRRLVVLHEAEHLRAGDHVLLALVPLAVVLMPWNLALWWMLRELRLAVELDCDGRVLARGVELTAYGSLLLDVAGSGGTHVLAPGLAMSRPRLERRLIAMLRGRSRWPWIRALPFGVAAIVCGALACEAAPDMPLDQDGEPAAAVAEEADADSPLRLRMPDTASPLILIDDVIATQEQMDALDPKAIDRVEIVKGTAAARVMPGHPRARNGVIMIYMKQRARSIAVPTTPERLRITPVPYSDVRRITGVPAAEPALVTPQASTIIKRADGTARRSEAVTPSAPSVVTRLREPRSLSVSETPRIYVDGELSDYDAMRKLDPDMIERIEVIKVRQPGEIHVTTRRR
jgi:hypothetical protein